MHRTESAGYIKDMALSFKKNYAEKHESIPDDVVEAAVAFNQQHSDDEDPFGPQPKIFMETEHQKKERKRKLYIRQVASELREEERDESSRFRKLPPELILKTMQHIDLSSLDNFVSSSEFNKCIFEANENAIYRGMEIERFPDWKWLFGNTVHRTSAQAQHLKDAISVEYCFGKSRLDHELILLETLRMIDNKIFTGVRNIKFLQDMQDRVDTDLEAIESYTTKQEARRTTKQISRRTTKQIARRTAMCLRSLSFLRPIVVEEKDRVDNGPLVHCLTLPWVARSELIVQQPASIQAEIRSLLMVAIQKFYRQVQKILKLWTRNHYRNPGNHGKAREVKRWMSKLVTGLILQDMAPQWYAASVGNEIQLTFELSSSDEVGNNLSELLAVHNQGIVDVLEEVEEPLQFGRSIGIDLEGLVDGTPAGSLIDLFGPSDDTEV